MTRAQVNYERTSAALNASRIALREAEAVRRLAWQSLPKAVKQSISNEHALRDGCVGETQDGPPCDGSDVFMGRCRFHRPQNV
jgi:hypothetical protein